MKRNWRKILVYFLVFVVSIPIAYIFWQTGKYLAHVGRFNFYVSQRNAERAKDELDSLRVFYNRANGLGLGWLANRTLFRRAPLYEAEYAYLIGDYDGVNGILSDTEDPLGYRIRGAALFRLAQSLYQRKGITSQVQSLTAGACEDFESALKSGPPDVNFSDDMWNFDICDPNILRKALSRERRMPLVIFGFPVDMNETIPAIPGKRPPGRALPQIQSRPGQSGGAKRRP